VEITVRAAAEAVGCEPREVFVASTGVIGEPMDASAFAHLLKGLAKTAAADAWEQAARAIMTTDTYPKLAVRRVRMGDGDVTLAGLCKGAGMIAPDMATMLCFLFTDAAVAQPVLQRLIADTADKTFNCITIDGDTSTSDTVLLFATGKAAARGAAVVRDAADPNLAAFAEALHSLMHDLALQVVKDGEGLSKFVTVEVLGAEDDRAARRIAFSVANSPILKTAIAGEDPNWGRVVMAVGKSGEAADRDRLAIWFGPHLVAREGERAPGYSEPVVAKYMKNAELTIRVDVGVGAGKATVWTCDLTHDYVAINADYRS
jgi:glutamate N-acetyltransferase/amino-acid N-acetyltransferase